VFVMLGEYAMMVGKDQASVFAITIGGVIRVKCAPQHLKETIVTCVNAGGPEINATRAILDIQDPVATFVQRVGFQRRTYSVYCVVVVYLDFTVGFVKNVRIVH